MAIVGMKVAFLTLILLRNIAYMADWEMALMRANRL